MRTIVITPVLFVRFVLQEMVLRTNINASTFLESAKDAVQRLKGIADVKALLIDVVNNRLEDLPALLRYAAEKNIPAIAVVYGEKFSVIHGLRELFSGCIILEEATPASIVSAVTIVCNGEKAWPELLRDKPGSAKAESQTSVWNLTNREMQVLRHVALGLGNKEIALSLNISYETVKEHVQHVLRKMNVKDRTQAAVAAVRKGLI